MILKGVNLNKVYNDSSRQEYIKEYGHYYLDIELNNDKVLVYDKGEIVDEILLDKAVKILFERRKTFKVILMEEGYYVIRFCDIHKHSAYSILDGMSTIKDIVKKTEYCGALTDHGNMYGFLKFYNAMISANKKPIIGFEAYTEPYFKGEVTKKGARAHLILLAKNEIGFKNIVKLCSIGFEKGYKSKKTVKPIIPYEDLLKHKDGIIVTSACLGGDIQKNLMKDGKDSIEKAYEIAKLFKDNFGEDYYIEIQRHNMQEELKVNFHLLNIADKLGIKAVAGIDSHYIEEGDRYYQEILLASNTGTTMSNPNRWVFEGDGYHMLTSEDMEELFGDMPELLDNTLEIADKVNLEIETGNYHLPEFEVPDEFKIHENPKNSKELDENQYSYLHYLCRKGMDEKGFTGVKEYEERLDFELGVIRRMGYSAYFLIVWDFVSWAKSQGILVGPGRGSACGSLASYVLTITDVDPLRYGLLFERFLSPDRVSMPDVDIDFQDNRREEVIDYVKRKYGEDCVSNIITFGNMKSKSAIRDVARILDFPPTFGDKIAKLVPDKVKNLSQALETSVEFRDLYDADKNVRKVVDTAIKVEGLPKSIGKHACFDENTLISTDNGLKRIIDIKIGDKVLTHNLRYKPVVDLIKTETDIVYVIGLEGLTPIRVTPNHPLYVKSSKEATPQWKAVGDINFITDYLAVPLNEMSKYTNTDINSLNTEDYFIDNQIIWIKLNSIEFEEVSQSMYNLTVLDDSSYIAGGIIAHNCGILISPKPITEFVPQVVVMDETGEKDEKGNKIYEEVKVTQVDMVECESLGMLKMDFLGLRNLAVIAGSLERINRRRVKEGLPTLTMDDIPINDPYAYAQIQSGKTVGVFQLESPGMTDLVSKTYLDIQKYIELYEGNKVLDDKGLGKFSNEFDALFERLIALISLYRPGPMDEIPNYLKNMSDPEHIIYDVPELEKILSNTYGVIVYQEQVMHAVRELAGFSAGQSDVIRKAMGKKKKSIVDEYGEYFIYGSGKADEKLIKEGKQPLNIKGCVANGIDENKAKIIWEKMYKFAEYAFNKSHKQKCDTLQ